MRIIEKIEKFLIDNYRDMEKSRNIVYMIGLYYCLPIISGIIYGLLLNDYNIYGYAGINLLILGIIGLCYLYFKKDSKSEVIWSKRKMNIKIFLFGASLLLVKNFILESVIKIFYEARGIEESMIKGTVAYTGTSPDIVISVVIIGPMMEEFIFRGAGFSMFRKNDNKIEAIIFTSVIFGLMHANLLQAISATISGFIYGYVAIEFGIIYSIIFHIFNNGILYVEYFLNLDSLMTIISIIILFLLICNVKTIKKRLKVNLNSEKQFSMKRLLVYFLNPILLILCILWIWMIILSI